VSPIHPQYPVLTKGLKGKQVAVEFHCTPARKIVNQAYNQSMVIDIFEIAGHRVEINASIRPIHHYTHRLQGHLPHRYCLDLGASDGLGQSNTLHLFMQGWRGLLIEAETRPFQKLQHFYHQHIPWAQTLQAHITPDNLLGALESHHVPTELGFVSLDIDSFDYEVLATLLSTYQPAIICAEINEKIPPPLQFWVTYTPGHVYQRDHFYGMSLSAFAALGARFGYQLVHLCFNNAFLIHKRWNQWPVLSQEQAYDTYRYGPHPPWNDNVEALLHMSPEQAVLFLQQHFAAYAGRYHLQPS
jgi:hypothetical protein